MAAEAAPVGVSQNLRRFAPPLLEDISYLSDLGAWLQEALQRWQAGKQNRHYGYFPTAPCSFA
jgi:hypothetical protein